jgi:hypothetical protein
MADHHTYPAIQLAECVAARISHDLSGAIGAVGAGVEMLDDDPTAIEDPGIMDLFKNSTKSLNHRITFLRAAFGSTDQGTCAPENVQTLITHYLATLSSTTTAPHVQITPVSTPAVPKPIAQAIYLSVLIGLSSALLCQKVDVDIAEQGKFHVRCFSQRIKEDTQMGHCLRGEGTVSAHTAPAALLHHKGAGATLTIAADHVSITGQIAPTA